MEVEREEILLEIIWNSTFVISEIMKNKKRKKKRAIWIKDWLKRREEKGTYKNIISDRHRFHQENLIGTYSIFW